MKLLRFGLPGEEKPGLELSDGKRIDVSAFGQDFNEEFFGTEGISRLKTWLESNIDACPVIPAETRLGPCVSKPSKIICVGLNYAKHAAESGMDIPKEPILFYKSTTAVCGPNDVVMIPRDSEKTDWEVELAVVIGKRTSYVEVTEAMDYVAGFCLHNDYSERSFQLERGGQWLKGKSSDTFAPLGPWLVTKDEIGNPHNLHLWLELNGTRLQDSNTSDLIFNIPFLVSYISQFMTLLPGDIISTGTPAGVGMGLKPAARYLKAGDVVRLGIEGLGEQQQTAIAWKKH